VQSVVAGEGFAKMTLEEHQYEHCCRTSPRTLFQLPKVERGQLLQELHSEGNFELSEEEKDELRAIVAGSEANLDVGVSWQELRAELQTQVQR